MILILCIVVAAAICAMLGVKGLKFLGNLIVLVLGGVFLWATIYSIQHPTPDVNRVRPAEFAAPALSGSSLHGARW
jgi:purine-cytosine permease-like protein